MSEQPNVEYIDKLADGDTKIRERLISVLKNEFPTEVMQYNEAITSQNYSEAAELVHKIKHKFGLLGLEKSYYISKKYEQNLKNNLTNDQIHFEKTITIIEEFLKNI